LKRSLRPGLRKGDIVRFKPRVGISNYPHDMRVTDASRKHGLVFVMAVDPDVNGFFVASCVPTELRLVTSTYNGLKKKKNGEEEVEIEWPE